MAAVLNSPEGVFPEAAVRRLTIREMFLVVVLVEQAAQAFIHCLNRSSNYTVLEEKDATGFQIFADEKESIGITDRMVTGDNLNTGKDIARECGTLTDKGLANESEKFQEKSEEELPIQMDNHYNYRHSSSCDTHLNNELSLPSASVAEHIIDVDLNHVNHGTHMEDGWSPESNDSRRQMQDTDSQRHIELSTLLSLQTQQSIDNNPNGVNHEIHQLGGGWSRKVEQIFVTTNLVLETVSTIFEQLSSMHKPKCALISMLVSFIALLVCIVVLIYKGRKEKVAWKWTGCRIPWFYKKSTGRHFGSFNDIIGLACAISQFILSTISYSFVYRNANNPIKISVCSIIFAVGVWCSKFLEAEE